MTKDLFKLLGIGLVLFAAGFLLKSAGVAELSAETPSADSTHLTFMTTDGLTLHAWKSEAIIDSGDGAKHRPGLVLLLPMMSKTYKSYDPFIQTLNAVNYTTLAFDMRGRGLSTKIGKKSISYANMNKNQFALMPEDIGQFFLDFRAKHSDDYNYHDVVIIGASIGANTAALLLAEEWVTRVVLLSPGRDYRGLQPEMVMAVEDRPLQKSVYIAASDEDTYSAESSQWLFDNYDGPKVFKKYPGQDHGTDILHNIKEADTELLSWLRPKK
jgi:alpha-beta hydrolase superfamily lysophospholipase